MKKYLLTASFISIFLLSGTKAYSDNAERTEIIRTGLFHGQVAIEGLKNMIYYLDKSSNIADSEETDQFTKDIKEALVQAQKSYELFQNSLNIIQKGMDNSAAAEAKGAQVK